MLRLTLTANWTDNQRLSLIHDPKFPSSFNSGRWRRGYNPDIIFATNRISGCGNNIVMEPVPRSQHRPIGVQVHAPTTVQTVPFRRRFNLKKANFALRKFARKNITRGCRRNYVPGLPPESIQLIEECRVKYEDDLFTDSTITLEEELMRNAVKHGRP